MNAEGGYLSENEHVLECGMDFTSVKNYTNV